MWAKEAIVANTVTLSELASQLGAIAVRAVVTCGSQIYAQVELLATGEELLLKAQYEGRELMVEQPK